MHAGRLSKRSANVTLTGNAIKKHIGLALSEDEGELEAAFARGRND